MGVAHAKAEDYLATLDDASVDLIVTDPPYFRVKGLAWDRAWSSADGFIAWLGSIADEWRRVLKPNGALVCFAANNPSTVKGATMAARVEVMLADRFEIVNAVTWVKDAGWHNKASPTQSRSYAPQTERVIVCAQHDADGWASGESQYHAQCDKARGFVFEPLRAYLDGERERAGLSSAALREGMHAETGKRYVLARHAFSRSQWEFPTAEQYAGFRAVLQRLAPRGAPYCTRQHEDLRREYEDLRREYEDLRREYEDLRRPFDATEGAHYTDVWTYPTVQARKGKHPCEKPRAMAVDIIRQNSRPGAVVLDTFAGSGAFLSAAAALGRTAIGCDADEWWAAVADRAVRHAATGADESEHLPTSMGTQLSLGRW